jgi:hypothetical protein
VHTGATPGAFPAGGPPALTRIAEGAEPPIYVGQPVRHYPVNTMEPNFAPRSGPNVAPPPGVMAEPVAVPAPGHGAPAVVPPRTIIMPAPVSTETYSVVPTVPVGTGPATAEPARPATPPTEADPHWQPVSGAPGTLIPSEARSTTRQADVVQAVAVTTADVAEPDWRPASIGSVRKSGESGLAADTLFELERTVRDACRTSVTVTELVSAGPRRVTVRYTAPSVAAAEEAVIAITRLPQLKPYAVEYDGKVVGK